MLNLKERFELNLTEKNLIKENEKILLGVSGGPDSLTMLDLLYNIKDKYNLKINVFHLNHSFRSESDEEAEFVRKFCESRGIKTFIKKYDVPSFIKNNNLSPEQGARIIRFKFLKEFKISQNADKVFLAHNKDDHIETILLNIFRGSGLKGLRGIREIIEIEGMKIVHPLIIFYRSEIMDYIDYNNLKPVMDPSNESNLYSRNRIRNKILPLIESQINSNVKQSIDRLSKTVSEDYDFIKKFSQTQFKDLILEYNENKYILNINKLKSCHKVILKRIIDMVIYNLKGNTDNFYYKHYQDIINFIDKSKPGKKIDLPDNIKMKTSYNKLIIIKGDFISAEKYLKTVQDDGSYRLPYNQKIELEIVDEKLDWRNYKDKNNIILVDFDKVEFPLTIRNRKNGDSFIPLGMDGHKKVKDFFIDEKVPDYLRDIIPIIFDNKEKLIWICGYRMDDRFKINELSKKIILIKYFKEDLTDNE